MGEFRRDRNLNSGGVMIDAIHELSPNSEAGPDCVPSSLLVNCATELAPVLLLIFSHSVIQKSCYSDLHVWR